jgi:hypothetical protein
MAWERTVLALIAWGLSSAGIVADRGPVPHMFLPDSVTRGVVERAILGAQVRLRRRGCRAIFTDFTDQSGRTLVENLESTGLQPAEYVFERVWFVDGSNTRQCVTSSATAAFTEVGSKVVYVCAATFAKLGHHQTSAAECLIIHELLHTLGLDENPPSSAEITARVTARCGGS